MRLTDDQRRVVREEVRRAFGPEAPVRLFGSRVDDRARGGDIDLHIEAAGDPTERLQCELRLRAALMRRLGERRVDIVVHGSGEPVRSIDTHARATGVLL